MISLKISLVISTFVEILQSLQCKICQYTFQMKLCDFSSSTRLNNQFDYTLITESWDHQKLEFSDPCIIKLKYDILL